MPASGFITPLGGTQTNQVSSSYSRPHAALLLARATRRWSRPFFLVLRLLLGPALRLLPAVAGADDLAAVGPLGHRWQALGLGHRRQVGSRPETAFDAEVAGRPMQQF